MTGTVCKYYYDMSKSTSRVIIPPPALTIQDNVIELSRNFTQNTSIYTLFNIDKGLKINISQKLYLYVFFVKYASKKDRTNVRSLSFLLLQKNRKKYETLSLPRPLSVQPPLLLPIFVIRILRILLPVALLQQADGMEFGFY